MNICPKCGLPKELCVCETIAKETQRIKVYLENKKFGKNYTVITGIDQKEIDIKKLMKTLKSELACGGTDKEGRIELQGDHRHKVKEVLVKFGFAESQIEVK
ncbi:MAG: stress response translation initiation inhibitor YciH [Candidatus Woesearchaeota archaeon]